MTTKKSSATQESQAANTDDRVLVHLQQAVDLAGELLVDIGKFRGIDQSNGRNEESVGAIEEALRQFRDQGRHLRSTVLTSQKVYVGVKNLYMSMQDTKIYFGQALKKPATSAKDSFVEPMKTVGGNLHTNFETLMQALTAEIEAINSPNPQISVEVYQLGLSHMYGLEGRPVNYTVAVQYFEHAAANGNTEAMAMLAKCYLHGHGVEQSESTGMEWLTQAANSKVCPHAKNELAMLIIANLRERHSSCVRDYCAKLLEGETSTSRQRNGGSEEGEGDGSYGVEHAIKLLLEAASDGCVDAKSNLGSIYEEAGDIEQAASWYNQASEEGCARGTYLLGNLFLKGKLSASKAQTFALLQQAAKSGQMEAFYCLGTCYEQGVGVDESIDLAVQHYRKGAKLGSKLGMYSLGYLLVQNAIEMRRKLKQLRPYAAERSHVTSLAVVESNLEDEQYATMADEAEGMLQEGIHWLRAASENHVKDAAFQLGRLYEQAIGVPNDGFAALANYKWAAQLGHPRAAFFAGNLLYAHAHARGLQSVSEAAVYYQQAALGGIVEAMNSYAILLEDGRASDVGAKDPHLAAAWFYQACVERDRLEKAFVNLAMLIIATPLSSFRTIPGDIVTLPDLKDFLLDYFESDYFAHDERKDAILQMVDGIDEHNPAALPLVEEVSLSLSASRGLRSPGKPQEQAGTASGAAGRTAPPRPPRPSRNGTTAAAPASVTVGSDDGEVVEVHRIPTSQASTHTYSTAHKASSRVQEEVHKLSRGPIQNQGFSHHTSRGRTEERLVPPRSTSPPVHAQQRRSGEMYSTDGPVIPPSFVPRAIQYNAPTFKQDKPQPHPKPDQVPPSYLNNAATAAASAPPVPVLSSPTRRAHPGTAVDFHAQVHLQPEPQHQAQVQTQAQPPVPPPRPNKFKVATAAVMATSSSAHKSAAATAPASSAAVDSAERSASRERAPKSATRRLSFISGLVKMLGTGGDKEEDANAASEEGKTSTEVPFQQQGGAHAENPQIRKSVDSLPTKRPSVWKTLKNATHLGASTSKSMDLSAGASAQHAHPTTTAPASESSPAPAGRSAAGRSVSAPRGTLEGVASATSRHSAPNNTFSAGASVKRPGVSGGTSHAPNAPQRSVSESSAGAGASATGPVHSAHITHNSLSRPHTAAQGVFASEPQPVPSPAKPTKPRFLQTVQSAQNRDAAQDTAVSAITSQTVEAPATESAIQPESGALQMEMPTEAEGAPAPAGQAPLPVEQSTPGSVNGSAGNKSRDGSPSKHNSLVTMFMQAKHKKYLGKGESANANAAAASSTGTMESEATEPENAAEEPDPPQQTPDARDTSTNSGPRPAGFIQSPTVAAPVESEVTEFDNDEFFEPVSDLSISSRDIRR